MNQSDIEKEVSLIRSLFESGDAYASDQPVTDRFVGASAATKIPDYIEKSRDSAKDTAKQVVRNESEPLSVRALAAVKSILQALGYSSLGPNAIYSIARHAVSGPLGLVPGVAPLAPSLAKGAVDAPAGVSEIVANVPIAGAELYSELGAGGGTAVGDTAVRHPSTLRDFLGGPYGLTDLIGQLSNDNLRPEARAGLSVARKFYDDYKKHIEPVSSPRTDIGKSIYNAFELLPAANRALARKIADNSVLKKYEPAVEMALNGIESAVPIAGTAIEKKLAEQSLVRAFSKASQEDLDRYIQANIAKQAASNIGERPFDIEDLPEESPSERAILTPKGKLVRLEKSNINGGVAQSRTHYDTARNHGFRDEWDMMNKTGAARWEPGFGVEHVKDMTPAQKATIAASWPDQRPTSSFILYRSSPEGKTISDTPTVPSSLAPKHVIATRRLPEHEGHIFASPSVVENSKWGDAIRGLSSPEHKAIAQKFNEIIAPFGGKLNHAIGSLTDGAEDSTHQILTGLNLDDLKYLAAKEGSLAHQKQVGVFYERHGGPDTMYEGMLDGLSPEDANYFLPNLGVKYFTLEPERGGTRFSVIDMGNELKDTMDKIGSEYDFGLKKRSGDASFIGDPAGESRQEAERAYREIQAAYSGKVRGEGGYSRRARSYPGGDKEGWGRIPENGSRKSAFKEPPGAPRRPPPQ